MWVHYGSMMLAIRIDYEVVTWEILDFVGQTTNLPMACQKIIAIFRPISKHRQLA